MDPEAAVFIEICCGSASLSSEAQRSGFQVFPIDYSLNRFKPKASVVQIDLSLDSSIDVVVCMVQFLRPKWIHCGLPCGTCSRARERPVASHLRAAGAPNPRPLRDSEALLGKEGLTDMENQRVRLANKIYKLAIHVLVAGFGCGALASLENPSRSWLWAVLALLVKEMFPDPLHPFRQWFFNLEDCDFDMCMQGGERPKTTRLKASPGVFTALADRCDGKHSHKPWTVQKRDGTWTFDTAAEAEYPAQLAKRMVQCAVRKVPDSCLSFTYKHFRLHALQSIGKQHRQHRQLIAEFATILKLPTPPHNVEYKLLDSFDPQFSGEQDQDQKGMVDGLKKFGVYHTPLQHVQLAMNLQHPASISTIVPDVLRMNLFTILTCGMSHMAKRSADFLRKVMDMKRQLAESEAALRAKMDPNVSAVTSNKPLALRRSLLVESGFPDAEVVSDHMELGVDLVGLEPESRLYDVKYKPLMMTPEQLSGQAMWRRKAVIGQ